MKGGVIMFYLISYDSLKDSNEIDYDNLCTAIQSYESYTHIFDFTWLIASNHSAKTIFDNLKPYIKVNTHLFVAEINKNFKANLSKKTADWVNSKLF
jgi:hypothetical protein